MKPMIKIIEIAPYIKELLNVKQVTAEMNTDTKTLSVLISDSVKQINAGDIIALKKTLKNRTPSDVIVDISIIGD